MTTLREAAEMALKSMEHQMNYWSPNGLATVVSTLRKALEAEGKEEPVAWMDREGDIYKMPEIEGWAPPHVLLYTTPPKRKPLTDEEVWGLMRDNDPSMYEAFRLCERAHGIGG